LYQLSRHTCVQEELRQELLSIKTPLAFEVDRTPEELMALSDDLYHLPLLNAVIKETMRLRNSSANMDPRVTPPGQLSDIGPYKNLPPGIRVGGYAYLLHRSESQYSDPLKWNPYRWLEQSADSTTEGERAYFAFGGGSRGCIGQNVAYECKSKLFPQQINYSLTRLGTI
jgi:cytochrome P450